MGRPGGAGLAMATLIAMLQELQDAISEEETDVPDADRGQ